MEGLLLTVFTVLVLAFSLVNRKVSQWQLSAPIVFGVAGGILAGPVEIDISRGVVLLIAELTLVVLLFHDASTVQLSRLRNDKGISLRLLVVGFPLAVLLTFLAARGLIPDVGVAGALLVAGALTPTDAGLGAATMMDPRVPVRVRRALNVESGLNDGLATPIVLVAIGMIAVESGREDVEQQSLLAIGAVPVALGLVVGLVIGVVAARLLDLSERRAASTLRSRAISVLSVPVLCLAVAELVGANSFIAAFVGGLAFGTASRCVNDEPAVSETVEITADLLGYVIWFIAGGLVITFLEAGVEWEWILLAVLALTVLRVVPVAVSMIGTHFRWQTVLFLGWFGPRGLATVVFGLIALEELGPGDGAIAGVLSITVALSVILHGVTAGLLAAPYGAWARTTSARIEMEPAVEPMPSRGRSRH